MARVRKLSKNHMASQLSCLTVSVLDEHREPPQDLAAYDELIELMRASAAAKSEGEDLRLTIALLLGRDDMDLGDYNLAEFPWTNDELRRVFRYAYDKLWPEHPIPAGGPPDVELVDMSSNEWAVYKRSRPS